MKNIVIIGGGLGGLTSGALLSKDGYKVTLLEQHNIVGGCATIFKRKGGFICEVGLHEMEGVYSPQIKKIFDKLEVYKNVAFIKPQEFFKLYSKFGEFVMPDGVENAKKALKVKFQNEVKAIDKYFEIILSLSDCFERLSHLKWYHYLFFPFLFAPILKYKNKSVSEVLNSLTQNEELKLILNATTQYYNDSPKTLSILLHAIAQSSYYKGGGYFIKGGSYKLSRYLADVIEQNGGKVITKATVIKATKNEVIYTLANQNITLKADIIISNIAPVDTYKLFEIDFKEEKQIAESISTIYIGFSKNLKNIYGKGAYSNFIAQENKPFVFVDYSQIDSGLVDDTKSFGEICLVDELKNWEDLSQNEYKIEKELLLENVLSILEMYYPNIKAIIEFAEVATPKTMKRYTKTPNGTAYGYKPTPKQFFRIPQIKSQKINNLYFVGQFVIAGGFSPAIISAEMCCKRILKDT
ncbi:MAG: NAD(P)-binding protein [Sulfurimonas sp.]|nr:NAD(P)-binding protein [Sulfurimonas sp.]